MENLAAVSKKTRQDLAILKKQGVLRGFYLGGGTGLAFLLGHRESHDLDFFSQHKFNSIRLVEQLRRARPFSLEKREAETVRGKLRNTLVSFFHYPYPLLKRTKLLAEVPIASLLDIACMKLDAIAARGTKRDFIDLYAILQKREVSIPELLRAFSKKYTNLNYNLMHVKKSLVYFSDAEKDPSPKMVLPLNWAEVKKFFSAEVKKMQ